MEPNEPAVNHLMERGRLERITPRREIAEHLLGLERLSP
jgi:hypothetical protein